MNIISKDKKEIQWIGFPSNGNRKRSDLDRLMVEKNQIRERIEKKTRILKTTCLSATNLQQLNQTQSFLEY